MFPNTSPTRTRNSLKRRGTAIVEMAFVVVILLMLTLGLIQWGMIFNASISITNLSREAARYAAVYPDSDADIETYVKDNSPPGISGDDLKVIVSPVEGDEKRGKKGEAITVTVEYNMSRKLFLPSHMSFPSFGKEPQPTITFFSGQYRSEGTMMTEG